MQDLIEEQTPRSTKTVERWTATVRKRIGRTSRAVTLAFFAIAIGGILFMVILKATSPGDGTFGFNEEVGVAVIILFFIAFLPPYAVRRIIGRDVRDANEIARDGVAYRARVGSHERLGFGGMHFVELTWTENGRDAGARFNIETLDQDLPLGAEVAVLARPGKRPVALVVGDAMVVGYRRRS